jgi:glycosyltransferase involved in cell wall biosynthesis
MAMWVFVKGCHFTSNSEYIRQYVERWTPHCAPVIPNGLHERYFIEEERTPNLKTPTLLSVNNGFGRRKNVRVLLRAFREVRREHPEATLRLMGIGFGEGEEAHDWSRERGLSEGVEFLGHVDHEEVIKALRDTDLLIHPALEESFGNPLVEAMAQRTPVVAGEQSGAVPWVLDGGEAGVLTDVNDHNALKEAIQRVLSSEKRWHSYSDAGYQRARNTFSLSRIVDMHINKYKELI